ncbi:centromere protein F-like isoform X1 [Mytilus californianus]|uniref:centromere protein F-like isoform X1 n=1 Tax=Mytilus californianus TaxID=6549 RepID=UPI002246794A|nr:centromere protein F-like isoform X1 [Mytilus californianus]XP_052065990.1 centromere protein F-like isoform X1 [Mytilus californianus]XP_052065991.1 centromere protein F-like isoform X1 [Mytilus californianus]
MASNWSFCGICNFRHVTKPSVVVCSECDEGLCDDCKEHHSISKSSRNHDIVPIDDYQTLPTAVLQIAQSCRKHNKKYQIFCKKHDCSCCKKCVVEEHNECKYIVDIDDAIQNVKSSNAFNEIELTLSSMVEYIERVNKDRNENLLSINEQKEQIETKVLQARETINNYLDLLQQTLIEALNLTIDKENKDIHQFLKSVEKNEKEIKEFQSNHLKIKQHASELQTFLTLKQMERDIATKEEFIQSINKSGSLSRHHFSLKIDTTLEKLASNVKIFGEIIKETEPSDIPFVRQKDKQAQLMIPVPAKSIDALTLTLVQSINTYSEIVRGCTMLPDGRMVFTCYFPGYVTVVNQDGSKDFEIKSGNACDVIHLGDYIIAVSSSYYSHGIHLVDIKLKTIKKTLHIGSSNDGIVLHDKDLIYCGGAQGLKKLSLRDDSVSTIINSKLSVCSYVTTFNDTIIFTNNDTNIVTCASMQGQVKWKFKNESILKFPFGISVDNDGNVYVIGRDSCNVVVISPDGKRHRQILSANEGLRNPSVLHYDLVTNKLLVANLRERAFLYDVSS